MLQLLDRVLCSAQNLTLNVNPTDKSLVANPVRHMTASNKRSTCLCLQVDGVLDVHDLHVWNLSLGIPIMTAHVHVDASRPVNEVR